MISLEFGGVSGALIGGIGGLGSAGGALLVLHPLLKPLACKAWNLKRFESESTIKCCWLGTDDLRMCSLCRTASL